MKDHLDHLMESRNLDAALITGGVQNNPAMYYMANGASLTSGFVIKKRGADPVLLCWPIERRRPPPAGSRS